MNIPGLHALLSELAACADHIRAQILRRFFKTGKGEYGQGDIFLGIPVPQQRKIAKAHQSLPLVSIKKLLCSSIHEHRFTALLLLIQRFERGIEKERKEIFYFYLAHRRWVNNWDLVDVSAPKIVGAFLVSSRSRTLLQKLARSKNIWDRRIAIVATYAFIRNGCHGDTIAIARVLLSDTHDLMHKAVGWMLREVGKKDRAALENFLNQYAHRMPRTCLRYAIERLSKPQQKYYRDK